MASEEDQNMDDILYIAARDGTTIPSEVNFHSQALGVRNNALHVAAQYGNHEFITQALAQLPEHHYQHLCQLNSNGETPLHEAAKFGDLETVRVLLHANFNTTKGFDLGHRKVCWRERDHQGDTPLHKALKHGHDGIAMEMLNTERSFAGGSFNSLVSVLNDEGNSLAYLAAENYCFRFLHELLEDYDPNVVSLSGYKGQTVLHSGRRFPDLLMSFLIEKIGSLQLKKKDDFGKTVLHYAVEENRYRKVKALLRADTTLGYMRDNDGFMPLDVAFKKGLFPMVKIILEMSPQSVDFSDGHSRTPLHHTKMDGVFLKKCRKNMDKRILQLLGNRIDNDGNTPMHVALINSELDAAFQLLYFKGYNWKSRNKDGYTPWDLCKSNDDIPHTSLLYIALSDLEAGIEILPRKKWTPYMLLAKDLFHITLERKDEEWDTLLSKIGVVAALLLPLNFAAAFTVPGGYDSATGIPILRGKDGFRMYYILNTVAFLTTAIILICCTLGIGNRANKKRIARCSIFLLQLALLSTLLAYLAGILATGVIVRGQKDIVSSLILGLGSAIVGPLLFFNYFN
ncbi:hypothetical protein V2J09_012399 [Rumex salicifolius]